jgi:4'-phosphopantetheinyl transferase
MARPPREPGTASAELTSPSRELTGLGQVRAWLIDLDADTDDRLLAPAERDRATSYVRPRDGTRFAASCAWLRLILSRYLDAGPAVLRFATGANGRPALAGDHAGLLHFSLSRSAGLGLVAVSRAPVGADIERVSRRAGLADLVASRFGAAEADCIAGGCGGSPLRGFYRHWTAKEAYLKATGRGLAALQGTELVCGTSPAIRSEGRLTGEWTLSLLEPVADCVAAVVDCGSVTGHRRVRS